MVKLCSSFNRLVLPPCCWELCSACSRAETLHCSLNQQFLHSPTSFFPPSLSPFHTMCQGPFWWHHHRCHSHCGPTPPGEGASRTAAHVSSLRTPTPTHPPQPVALVSAVTRPRSVALPLQIIHDGFILITFSSIFFYRHATMPRWLWNIPQVGASLGAGIRPGREDADTGFHLQSPHLRN